jgi:hypothetical protein
MMLSKGAGVSAAGRHTENTGGGGLYLLLPRGFHAEEKGRHPEGDHNAAAEAASHRALGPALLPAAHHTLRARTAGEGAMRMANMVRAAHVWCGRRSVVWLRCGSKQRNLSQVNSNCSKCCHRQV